MSGGLLLAFNAGSSSIKYALFEPPDEPAGEPSAAGAAAGPHALRERARGQLDLRREGARLSMHDATEALLAEAEAKACAPIAAAGHRIVHGGLHYTEPVRIDDGVLDAIEALTPLAPLHQPLGVELVRALRAHRPALAQTASFDTAFHATQPALARRFAIPRALHDQGVQRYGFHGLSYRWIAAELSLREPALAAGKVVALHLGSGASLCALHGGGSVDTSMGFSTLDGVPMATRCGALDAGAVLYLQTALGMDAGAVEDLLYRRSGLLGVSGLSADMRVLRASPEPAAREAVDLFVRRCAGEVARLAASLQGLDALVFTAGIGERDAAARAAICGRLGWLGVRLDEEANARHAPRISAGDSRVAVDVIAADEERVVAWDTLALRGGR